MPDVRTDHDPAAGANLQSSVTRAREPDSDDVRRIRAALFPLIGQLAGTLAHDLRNPLGVIQNAVYLLRRRLAGNDHALGLLNMIETEVRAADAIIINLNELARARAPQPCDVQLATLVAEVMQLVDAEGRIRWLLDLQPDPCVVWCDPPQMRRVLQSLLKNAVEAMRGVGRISISASQTPEMAVIEVRDDGPGISPAIRPHLFEPLISSKKSGAGLGLAICRIIVEQHGGSIRETNRAGGGAAFRLELPRRPETVTSQS